MAFGNIFLNAIYQIVDLVFTIYIFIVVARALISWVNPDPYNPIVRFLHSATDPVLNKIRRVVPLQFGGIDFSPIILLIGLSVLKQIILQLLFNLSRGM
ncbi:MAG: YggT family protein [Desulfuromonadales bacterium]|nr:YggT family protein [Desulfuromonadales bacterium]NIR33811.1 YggT family protein [Desulfuromonadales bacterium]NIS41400.1 YggT family protein [Desulfuromonadales bacterium]